ncbi:MAG TPA: GNAT family N-acetyltransferase [Thermoanaerobaculia bacterium]|nr:GNAT family N-acetyltransferase [Thermoanaerobaculia bacterium]
MRTLPVAGGGLLWINRGPLLFNTRIAFEEILGTVACWARERRWYVRVAPPLEQLDPRGLEAAGFLQTTTPGWSSSAVDLTTSVDQLRSRLDQKWRNCLNKSIRIGVVVRATTDDSPFQNYLGALRQRLRRQPFETSVTPDLLDALQAALPVDRKMVVFTATHEETAIGRYVIATYGDTAEYLSSVVGDEGRQKNAGYALLWTAITEMRSRGYRRFDLGGMDAERTPAGIYHFKKGAGGTLYRLANEVETARQDWRSALIRWRIAAARKREQSAASRVGG